MKLSPRWDIFCAVVDNYGDAGVCWRLARQLASEFGLPVRLWIDDPIPLAELCPEVSAAKESQRIDGVEIRRWRQDFSAASAVNRATAGVAECVIEAFGCTLPDRYLSAMAKREAATVWINLEYLSAEDWVEGAHGLASPHPSLPLTRYFFFPGFTAKTGGLIKEAGYEERHAAFDKAGFRAKLGLPPERSGELTVSLFGYENAALPGLLEAWSHSACPVTCLVPEGRLLPEVRRFFGHAQTMQRGRFTALALPFLPQPDYDALLWLCDLNFVRGEDSFVRAQWAEKPFVWHIYPQAGAAHRAKLDAFLLRYLDGLPRDAAVATQDFWIAWNEGADAGAAWPAFAEHWPALKAHARPWAQQIAAHGNLAANLLHFVQEKGAPQPGK